jgi:hypothetical protein
MRKLVLILTSYVTRIFKNYVRIFVQNVKTYVSVSVSVNIL